MARDALQLLFSIRQQAVDQAHQTLTQCLKVEADIQDKIDLLEELARRDHLAVRESVEHALFLDMFVARLHQAQSERRALDIARTAAEARSAEARAALMVARRAEEAVETLLQERKAAAAIRTEKQEQHALDDIARTQHARHHHRAEQGKLTPT